VINWSKQMILRNLVSWDVFFVFDFQFSRLKSMEEETKIKAYLKDVERYFSSSFNVRARENQLTCLSVCVLFCCCCCLSLTRLHQREFFNDFKNLRNKLLIKIERRINDSLHLHKFQQKFTKKLNLENGNFNFYLVCSLSFQQTLDKIDMFCEYFSCSF
jgi:C4-dicarboxylate-specific signal transduction histidine kinase